MVADVGSLDSIAWREVGTVGGAATTSCVLDIVTRQRRLRKLDGNAFCYKHVDDAVHIAVQSWRTGGRTGCITRSGATTMPESHAWHGTSPGHLVAPGSR